MSGLDEHALASRIAALSAAEVDLATLLDQCRAARAAMSAIAPRGTYADKAPFDQDLRAPMSDERRRAIYDSWTDEIDSLLARLPPPPPAEDEGPKPAAPPADDADDDDNLAEIPRRNDDGSDPSPDGQEEQEQPS